MFRIYFVCFCLIISSCGQKEYVTGFSEYIDEKLIVSFKGREGRFYHYKNPEGELFSDSKFLVDTVSFKLTSKDLEDIQNFFVEEKIYNFRNINTDIYTDSVFISESAIERYEIYTNKRVIIVQPEYFGPINNDSEKKSAHFKNFYKLLENILSSRIEEESK
ncbi:hypothetical protein [Bergeyella sp. RCAD1439]|uniref:hypothetical protein n=1 Tax=Bergeyella anatis TaxID=3113737 RepID=UPI002E184BF5|nr:hypothetical protein [Bergeyella sp. RCAD1439]